MEDESTGSKQRLRRCEELSDATNKVFLAECPALAVNDAEAWGWPELRIGEVAVRVGVEIDTIRCYERRHLPPRQTPNVVNPRNCDRTYLTLAHSCGRLTVAAVRLRVSNEI